MMLAWESRGLGICAATLPGCLLARHLSLPLGRERTRRVWAHTVRKDHRRLAPSCLQLPHRYGPRFELTEEGKAALAALKGKGKKGPY